MELREEKEQKHNMIRKSAWYRVILYLVADSSEDDKPIYLNTATIKILMVLPRSMLQDHIA